MYREYFCRDELGSERSAGSSYYLYQGSGLLYGHNTEAGWKFGLKGTLVEVGLTGRGQLGVTHRPARFPL